MRKNAAAKILLFVLILSVSICMLKSQLSVVSTKGILSLSNRDTLLKQAGSSLKSLDVPVGSLIVYNDTILSSGYNTVLRDSNASGHAEINAINNAIRKIGFASFSQLDREKLILVTTFEPCLMCKGAIIEYNIHHVYFMKGKGLFHWLKNDVKNLIYEWQKRKTDGEAMQDSLFLLHPKFRALNVN